MQPMQTGAARPSLFLRPPSRPAVSGRPPVVAPHGRSHRDEIAVREEVRPAVHRGWFDPELGQDGGHLRSMFGAVVYRLEQEQRNRHPPRARRVITAHLDSSVQVRLCGGLEQKRVPVREPFG